MRRVKPAASCAVALLLAISLAAAPVRAAEGQALDELLARLNLGELRLHHMERTLERETDAT